MSTPNGPVPKGDQTPKLLATIITFDVLAVIIVLLRFVSRRLAHANLWWDDWFMLPAMVMFIASIVVDAGDIAHGAGKHVKAVGMPKVSIFLKYNYMGEIVYPLSLSFIKCSILCLYLRIFGINSTFRRVTYGLLAMAVVWGISVTLGAIFQCNPIAAAYNPMITQKKCINIRDYFVATSILNVLIDVGILALPLPSLWKLQLATHRKLTISAIFLLGIFTSAISITRTVAVYSLSQADITWDFVPVMLYSTLEIDTGLICSCLPVMAPLLHLVTRNRLSSSRERLSGKLSGRKEYASNPSNKAARHQANVTEGFSILREDSPEDPAGRGGNKVYAGARAHEHEVYAQAGGGGGHELHDISDRGQIYVTHGIDVER